MAMDLGKAKRILSQAFLENNEHVSEDDAAFIIVKSELQIKALREEMLADEKLAAASQIVKDLKAGYGSAIKYEESKVQYLLAKIEEIREGVNPSASM